MNTNDFKTEASTFNNALPLPVLGQKYNYFIGNKVNKSRRAELVITNIIPFDKINDEALDYWRQEVESRDWLYAKETDYFVIAELTHGDIGEMCFVRTVDDAYGWFSLGFWSGKLDIDGSLSALLNDDDI